MVSVRPSGDSVHVDSRENVFASPPSLPGRVVVDVVTRRSPPSVALVTVVEPRWPCSVRSEPSATNDWLYERPRLSRANRGRSYSQSFVADGSERTEQGHRGSTTVTRATLGGDRLVTTSTTTRPGKDGGEAKTFSRESTWTLSPDGRTLTIDTVMHTPRGDKTMRTIYLKS